MYEELVKWAISNNGEAKTGYDIRRGHMLDNWIGNYSMCDIDKINSH